MVSVLDAPMNGATREEFDNWIKLATDNKINATNSWDVALIDYFHELSVLREGDGINFQKASATLDGCVKIYTSRIDSAAVEIGRLLSGLTSRKDDDDVEGEGDEDDGEDDDLEQTADSAGKQGRHSRSYKSNGTLAKSFKYIKAKKMDSDLVLDPVFKKTLTEFDEGGAKSLLLNMLHIDKTGRVLFDTVGHSVTPKVADVDDHSNTSVSQEEVVIEKATDLSPIINMLKVDADFDKLAVCPSMDVLAQISATGDSPASILEKLQATNKEPQDVSFGGEGYEDFGMADNDAASIGDNRNTVDISHIYEQDNRSLDGPNVTMVRLFNENFIEKSVEVSHLGEMDLDLLNHFDVITQRTWAGPEHWKISALRRVLANAEENVNEDVNGEAHTVSTKRTMQAGEHITRKSKEENRINFFSDEEITDAELFKRGKNITLPQSQWTCESYHLLPEDRQFSTKNFIYLSLKPKKLINTTLFGTKKKVYHQRTYEDEGPSHIDENFYAEKFDALQRQQSQTDLRNKRLDSILEDDLQEIHQSFGDVFASNSGIGAEFETEEAGVGAEPMANQGYGSQLLKSLSNFRPNTINFSRVAKRVDVKALEKNLWDSLNRIKAFSGSATATEEEKEATPPAMKNQFKFTELINDLGDKYSKEERRDLSTSFCFICLLHLANKNGFTIENNTDFTDLVIHE